MADYLVQDTELTGVANHIRAKGGTSELLVWPDGYEDAIDAIQTGGILQSKSVTPTESAQTVTPDTGYNGLSQVSVGAISKTYVGSDVPRKSSSDLTASGATVTVPSGYYASQASKSVASGSVTVNTPSVDSSGLVTAIATVGAGYVAAATPSKTLQLTTQAAQTITPGTTDQTIAAGKYLTGAQTIAGDSNLVAANIAEGVSIFGVEGMHSSGVDTSDATATANDILNNKTAYVNGSKVTGNIPSKSSSNLTASGATVTAPAGYYSTAATKTINSGSTTQNAPTVNSSTGLVTATATVTAGYQGASTKNNTLQLITQAAQTITPGTTNQTIAAGKYLTGAQTIAGDSNLVAENIAEGVSIFGVTGTHSGGGGSAQIEVHPRDPDNSMPNDGYYTGFASNELPTIIWGYQKAGAIYCVLLIINNKQSGEITCIRESGDRSSTTELDFFEDPNSAGSYILNYWDSGYGVDCDFYNIYSIM